MSTFARSDPLPSCITSAATSSTVVYTIEQRAGSIPSLTLLPGGKDRSVMSLYLPVLWPLGTTPNLLIWRGGNLPSSASEKGPSMRPRERSLWRYSEMTSGCWSADSIFAGADLSGELCWKPTRKPHRSPLQI